MPKVKNVKKRPKGHKPSCSCPFCRAYRAKS